MREAGGLKVAPLVSSSLSFPGQDADRYGFHEDQLLAEHGSRVSWFVDGHEDDPRPPGAPVQGITEREAIIDAELAEVTYVHLSPEEFWAMKADGRWDAILAAAPKPGTRAWQHMRARLAGRAHGTNTTAHAALYDVSEQTMLNWRKTWGNPPSSRGTDLTPATKADVDTLLERLDAIHGDVRTTLEVVLDAFESQGREPSSNPVIEAKIDLLVDSVLRDDALADAD